MRQFERFYSALGRFQINTFSSDVNVYLINLHNISNCNGINIISCSKKMLGKHINQSQGASFLKNPTKNTNSAMIQTTQLLDVALSTNVYPNIVNLENSLYPYDDASPFAQADSHLQVLKSLTVGTSQSTILISTTVYKLLINITLLNISHKRNQ
jgi:hypothetical protein